MANICQPPVTLLHGGCATGWGRVPSLGILAPGHSSLACPLIHHPTPSSIPCGFPCSGPPLRSHASSQVPFTSNQTHHRHRDGQEAPPGRGTFLHTFIVHPPLEQPPLNSSTQTLRIGPHSASRGQMARTSPQWASVLVGRTDWLAGEERESNRNQVRTREGQEVLGSKGTGAVQTYPHSLTARSRGLCAACPHCESGRDRGIQAKAWAPDFAGRD